MLSKGARARIGVWEKGGGLDLGAGLDVVGTPRVETSKSWANANSYLISEKLDRRRSELFGHLDALFGYLYAFRGKSCWRVFERMIYFRSGFFYNLLKTKSKSYKSYDNPCIKTHNKHVVNSFSSKKTLPASSQRKNNVLLLTTYSHHPFHPWDKRPQSINHPPASQQCWSTAVQ